MTMIRMLVGGLLIPCILQVNYVLADLTPEQEVLGRYVGEWDGVDQGEKFTFDSHTTWKLNGQIIEQKQVFQDGEESLILRGYDKQSKKYFLSLHDSRGIHLMLTGAWNEATKTFTYTGHSGEMAVTVKSTFRNDFTEDWTITLVLVGGAVTELRGTNTRVTK
ncbi:DUF1579 domain-containing protein [Planctomycetaceae bacterium]|nr:DUF1579 domain-containing protein [Planctomycetaceae bacterium]